MTARVLMVQGTSSSAGKSLLVAALCRIFARQGVRVAPFKAQNMSNNAAVCADGAEIGRSQALQAAAARVRPTADMNPILLKPEADQRSQVIVQGRPWRTLEARLYFRVRDALWPVVTAALDRLRDQYELVVIEGAGSPAELNLRDVEIVNMAVARYARAPVLLVGDIERGGIFAQLLGTLWLLEEKERALVRGMIVNKFRGDRSLFDAGVTALEARGGIPVLGVVPWLADLHLPEEDAVALDEPPPPRATGGLSASASDSRASAVISHDSAPVVAGTLRVPVSAPGVCGLPAEVDIAVIRLPRIANFDDFDPLAAEPGVRLRYAATTAQLGCPDAVILPGTKSTIADLDWLRGNGLAERILALASQGAAIVGICGGYQMLGRSIHDPEQIESTTRVAPGLALLPLETVFVPAKETHQVRAVIEDDRHCPGCRGEVVEGYEIHSGRSSNVRPWLNVTRRSGQSVQVADGGISADGRVWGCYLHGLFASAAFRRAWLRRLGHPSIHASDDAAEGLEHNLDRLADGVAEALDMSRLAEMIGH